MRCMDGTLSPNIFDTAFSRYLFHRSRSVAMFHALMEIY